MIRFLTDFGNSLLHWVNYLKAVDRDHLLNEYGIRYATSEYLEVEKNKHSQTIRPQLRSGAPFCLKDYQFEKVFPIFDTNDKHADLYAYDEVGGKKREIYVEFKYCKDKAKVSDYKSDIFRLAVLSKNQDVKTYFLLVTSSNNLLNSSFPSNNILSEITLDEYNSRVSNNSAEKRCSFLYFSSDVVGFSPRDTFNIVLKNDETSSEDEGPTINDSTQKPKPITWKVKSDVIDIAKDEYVTSKLVYAPVLAGIIGSIQKLTPNSKDSNIQANSGDLNNTQFNETELRVFIWEIGCCSNNDQKKYLDDINSKTRATNNPST